MIYKNSFWVAVVCVYSYSASFAKCGQPLDYASPPPSANSQQAKLALFKNRSFFDPSARSLLHIEKSIPVYQSKHTDLHSRNLLKLARLRFWDYPVSNLNKLIGFVEFYVNPDDPSDCQFNQVTLTENAEDIKVALSKSNLALQGNHDSYEIREIYNFPLKMIWLHGRHSDYLIALTPSFNSGLVSFKVYPSNDAISILNKNS